jgi:hypothetical protein
MITWPWVSRRAFDLAEQQRDDWMQRFDVLLAQTIALKKDGYGTPAKTKVIQPPQDPEIAGMRRAESAFVQRASAKIVRDTGVDPSTAAKEARRLHDEVTDMHPGGG